MTAPFAPVARAERLWAKAGWIAAVPPTGAALVMLRSYPAFWPRLSFAAALITATGFVAAVIFAAVALNGLAR